MFKQLFWVALSFTMLTLTACGGDQATDASQTATTQESAAQGPLAGMEFEKTEYDFGTITEGDVVEHVFTFTNTGEAPLIIEDTKVQCGCTVPEVPKAPIKPGETGQIRVKFNSANKRGEMVKPVTIFANTNPKETKVQLVGKVNPKEDAAQ